MGGFLFLGYIIQVILTMEATLKLNYLLNLVLLYISLRLVVEFIYAIICAVVGIVFDPNTMQLLKYVCLVASILIMAASIVQEKRMTT